MPKTNDPNDRVWEQIDEILERDEQRGPDRIRIAKPVESRKVRSGTPLWYPTPEKLIALGIILLLAAAIGRRAVLPLALTGFIVAGIGYYMLVMRKRRGAAGTGSNKGSAPAQYWRGKPVNPGDEVKTRDGKIVEFPDTMRNKARRKFGRKR